MTVTRILAATPFIALLAACGGEATPGDGAGEGAASASGPIEREISLRQENFEGIGDGFKLVREELETDNPDMIAIAEAADDINARLQRVPSLFTTESSVEAGYDTEALSTIWEDPDGFAEATQNAIAASEDLMAAAATGDPEAVGGQVGNLGLNGCKACHDKFRVDDD